MALPEDQHAVQELTAQRADEALADRVHPRSLGAVRKILVPGQCCVGRSAHMTERAD
jgi:hypothetical protein